MCESEVIRQDGSPSCRCTTTLTGNRNAAKMCANKIQRPLHPMPNLSGGDKWTLLGSGDEDTWCGSLSYKPDGKWNATAEEMMKTFTEGGRPVFRCSSPLSRGVLKSKGGGISSVHFNADPSAAELLLKTTSLSTSSVLTEQWQRGVHAEVHRNQSRTCSKKTTTLPPGYVTKLMKHESSDWLETLWGNSLHQVHKRGLNRGKTRLAQVCLERGFKELVDHCRMTWRGPKLA